MSEERAEYGTAVSELNKDKARIIRTLRNTGRAGIEELIAYLEKSDFFTAPASSKYHGCYPGGLAQHSLNVLEWFVAFAQMGGLVVADESAQIACLLHDVCKAGAYLEVASDEWQVAGKPEYRFNKEHPKGHAKLSVEIVKRFIALSELEEKMILYHMGVYGLNEFDARSGEYPLRDGGLANAWNHFPAVKLIYFADEIATLIEQAAEKVEDGLTTNHTN